MASVSWLWNTSVFCIHVFWWEKEINEVYISQFMYSILPMILNANWTGWELKFPHKVSIGPNYWIWFGSHPTQCTTRAVERISSWNKVPLYIQIVLMIVSPQELEKFICAVLLTLKSCSVPEVRRKHTQLSQARCLQETIHLQRGSCKDWLWGAGKVMGNHNRQCMTWGCCRWKREKGYHIAERQMIVQAKSP